MFEEVVPGQMAQLGPAHPDTLRTNGNLATLLQQLGELAEARRLYEQVVPGQSAQLGPGHVDTLNSKAELASVLIQQHELEAAAALIEPAIESLVRLASPHRVSLCSLSADIVTSSSHPPAPPQVSQCEDERHGTGFVSIGLAEARSIHGEILSLRGDTSPARAELAMALAAQIRIGPEYNPELLKTRRRLAEMGERAAAPVQGAVGQRRERRERGKAARTE